MGALVVEDPHVLPLEGLGLRSVGERVVSGAAQVQLGEVVGQRGRLVHRGSPPRGDQTQRTCGAGNGQATRPAARTTISLPRAIDDPAPAAQRGVGCRCRPSGVSLPAQRHGVDERQRLLVYVVRPRPQRRVSILSMINPV